MNAKPLVFQHKIIDPNPTGVMNDVCLIGDINGDGKPDIVIASKYGWNNLVWYENPTWRRHEIGTIHAEAGGVLFDVNDDGRLDIIIGAPMDKPAGYDNTELWWYECPENPTRKWKPHTITSRFRKYHDQAVGDVDGDGEMEIVFASQGAGVLGYFDIPEDPTNCPWGDEYLHIIDDRSGDNEGVKIADLDGDGQNEIVCGPNIYKRRSDGSWSKTRLIDDFDPRTCIAIGDLDGDDKPDIVLTEGELPKARVIWLRNPTWEVTLLADDFYHPHSLELADFDGNGLLDIFVGEMGLNGYPKPREVVFRNRGNGRFELEIVGHLPTHCARVADLTGNGLPDIIGKPYSSGRDQVDILFNMSDRQDAR